MDGTESSRTGAFRERAVKRIFRHGPRNPDEPGKESPSEFLLVGETSVYPENGPVPLRERWRRYRWILAFAISTFFFEAGYIVGRLHGGPSVEGPPEIRPLPTISCPDGTLRMAPK